MRSLKSTTGSLTKNSSTLMISSEMHIPIKKDQWHQITPSRVLNHRIDTLSVLIRVKNN